ncbi:TIGR03619 family F420-dependent LLM class oxidoreductase [Nocardia stercoris]|uniref:TIGR03619 family F420-dependent LLM class oxidoreductase n=1 Tax=Nocardia stercoris TaxID=2483361 RepID=A0A3M2KZQ0_9NOCA|nr:TIGR03619 family F420-dependent LLM class oxidoreductase [Nocardia stercoris]RMI30624.1 TIGR03619 family F420-dependent LLM class oxidoreductase [Nocardia stercoris]
MRFTYAEAMTDPANYVPLAKAAEEAGFDCMSIPDSVAYPEESSSTYPYTADGNREFLADKPFIETFVLAATLAAVTTKLHFVPFVLKLPIRPPVLVAKQTSSLAAISGNRFSLGVGISPWPEDFEIMGVPFEKRGKRMDECIQIVRGLCAGGFFGFKGEFYEFDPISLTPAPTEPVPILVGGHSEPALRRAVTLSDGWMHAGGDPVELDKMLDRITALRAEHGMTGPFQIHVASLDAYTTDGIKRLEDKGVTDVIVGFRYPYVAGPDTEPLADKITHLQRYADKVIARSK